MVALEVGCSGSKALFWIQGCGAKVVSHTAGPLSAVGRDRSRRDTFGTSAPVDDLGFVDLVARVVGGRQARGVADRTVDVDHPAAGPADEAVVGVIAPGLVAGR